MLEKDKLRRYLADVMPMSVKVDVDLRPLAFCAGTMELTSYLDEMRRRLVLELSCGILAMHGKEEVVKDDHTTIRHFPASVWDHFKDAYFPLWALKRWPPRYVQVREGGVREIHKHYHLCPHVNVKPHGKHYEFLASVS